MSSSRTEREVAVLCLDLAVSEVGPLEELHVVPLLSADPTGLVLSAKHSPVVAIAIEMFDLEVIPARVLFRFRRLGVN